MQPRAGADGTENRENSASRGTKTAVLAELPARGDAPFVGYTLPRPCVVPSTPTPGRPSDHERARRQYLTDAIAKNATAVFGI